MSDNLNFPLITDYLQHWAEHCPERTWLRDRIGDDFQEWSWQQAQQEINAAAFWLRQQSGGEPVKVGILSRNCAHWALADIATIAAGCASIGLFTTQTAEITRYILEFSEVKVLFVGAAGNWAEVHKIVPKDVQIVYLPGCTAPPANALTWAGVINENQGAHPDFTASESDLVSLVYTSGTTGMPKGVMQSHRSMLRPMDSLSGHAGLRQEPNLLSYLPLAHIAEHQIILMTSLLCCAQITFNEDLSTLVRDMADVKPALFFGAPRVWEQLQAGLLAKFGGQDALDKALAADPAATTAQVTAALGFVDYDLLISAAAPIPAAIIEWFERLGVVIVEGYGQTESMATICNRPSERRVGSIGKPVPGISIKITEQGELAIRSDSAALGYYKQPEKTAETFVDGWTLTGDKARVDDDGFVWLTGRVKDYFKTIHGKFVAPPAIEGEFARHPAISQQCLLGRGMSKTVMVAVLAEGIEADDALKQDIRQHTETLNETLEKHARIGVVMLQREPWSIENGALTPTLKMKRDFIEAEIGPKAGELARQSAEQRTLLIEQED